MRSRSTVASVGLLSPTAADTDGDGLNDDVEIRNATNPAQRDTDGDGLQDILEIPFFVNADGAPSFGGWMLPYAYNATNGAVAVTRAWSDPLQADGDGDGLTDLFERTRLTCPTCAPWADPEHPEVYNPNVWNLSPVALYVEDDTVDGFVAPGESVVYTTTTENNLGSGQELVGELSLSVPNGVNGGPLAAPVNIANDERAALVSNLSFASPNSAAYDLTSHTQLTNFFETRWTWERSSSTSNGILRDSLLSVAVAPVSGWNGSHLVVTREQASGNSAIVAYIIDDDGSVVESRELKAPVAGHDASDPDVACNAEGVCLVLWGDYSIVNGNMQIRVTGMFLNKSLTIGDLLFFNQPTSAQTVGIQNVSVASNGSDFMAAWGRDVQTSVQYTRIEYAPVTVANGAEPTRELGVPGGLQVAAVASYGAHYTIAWTEGGIIRWRRIAQDGGSPDNKVYWIYGDGWPRADGAKRPPVLAYDEISGKTLMAYRSQTNELVARFASDDTADPFTLATEGVDGTDVTVALTADGENGGWIAAWTPRGGGRARYRAISPAGALRGDIEELDQTALTTLALICNRPRPLVDLLFNEDAGATVFADSSGNGHEATCAGNCPQSGVSGLFGNAVAFDYNNREALTTGDVDLTDRSFTLSAWVKYRPGDRSGAVISLGQLNSPDTVIYFGTAAGGSPPTYAMNCEISHSVSPPLAVQIPDDNWHHWACIFDATTLRLRLYLDGVEVASRVATNTFSGIHPLYIGALDTGGGD
ncbi:MAG: LamG domain-containing protein, partial [Caldilineaceae bacterium]|nr:LamG domain-containing protein [Caldilineaceae bacterium]